MLKLAVAAGLPLVAVSTRDTLNFPDVVERLTGKAPVRWDGSGFKPKTLYFHTFPRTISKKDPPDFDQHYEKLMKLEATLLIVNPPYVSDAMFNAGELPVPREMLNEFVMEVVESQPHAEKLVQVLGGTTLKETAELVRLTMARDHSLTPGGVVVTRKQAFQAQPGMSLVDPAQEFYEPDTELAEWIEQERKFFLHETDPRLIPRGLLFDGPPGTGKTSGAKYIAQQFGIPLYRIDIGATRTKWLGETEQNHLANLARLDNEEPCIALFDEIEKVFAVNQASGDSGTTTTMLSQLLWWLAEHSTRVLTIMTTNAANKLPKELHRERRIDRTMTFAGLDTTKAKPFVMKLLTTFKLEQKAGELAAAAIVKSVMADAKSAGVTTASQAALTEATFKWIKVHAK